MTKDIERERKAFEDRFQHLDLDFVDELGYCKSETQTAWASWCAAKAHEAKMLEGCVVVPESEIQMCYLDEDEYMYIDEPDNFLCDIPIGKTVEVSRRAYMDKTSCFAAIKWDAENEDVGTWELFETKEEADKAAAHCKAMLEAAKENNHE